MKRFSIVGLLVGCGGEPIKDGTSWTMKTLSDSVQTSYFLKGVEGAAPAESVGPLGSATTCIIAETSAGSRSVSTSSELYSVHTVMGTTEVFHPMLPSDDSYSSLLASVIQTSSKGGASSTTTAVVNDPNSTAGMTSTVTYADTTITTDASFYAVAADEYVVRFELGNIWLDPEEELNNRDVELLTRNNPEVGDIWSSANGNTIYAAQGVEQVSFAGVVKKANKIAMFEVGNLQTDGADVIDQCFNVGLSQNQSNDPDDPSFSSSTIYLDAGCQGAFEHVRTGTQWWYGSVLVKEESVTQRIEINEENYGYEWYELDETGSTCTRVTSTTMDSPTATLFVQYDLITETTTKTLSAWLEE